MATNPTKNMVKLFSEKQYQTSSNITSINLINDDVSVRGSNGKQLSHLRVKDEQARAKLATLFSDLEKLCIRDANYWIILPTGSWVRKNAILGYQQHQSSKRSGVILRTQHNQILSFIPSDDLDMQRLIIQELHKATESKNPSRRYKPDWAFYNQAA